MLTIEDIQSRLNLSEIEQRARNAATQLKATGSCLAIITPGDMTRYVFGVHHASTVDADVETLGSEWWVTSNFGPGYHWEQSYMTADYVTDKWVANDNLHTGVVLTLFLNALANELALKDAA